MSMWITHNYTKEERRNTPLSWNLRPTSRQNIIHHQSTKNPNMRSQRALMGQNTKKLPNMNPQNTRKLQLDTKPQPTRPLLMTRQQHMKLQQQLMRHQQLMKNQQPRNQNMKNQQSTRSLSQNQRRRDIREDTFGNDPSLEKENELP